MHNYRQAASSLAVILYSNLTYKFRKLRNLS